MPTTGNIGMDLVVLCVAIALVGAAIEFFRPRRKQSQAAEPEYDDQYSRMIPNPYFQTGDCGLTATPVPVGTTGIAEPLAVDGKAQPPKDG